MNLHKVPFNGRVAVIGGGISGLSFSYFLNKLRPDIKIAIFESQNQPGGWIKSEYLQLNNDKQKVLLEKGPRTLRGVSGGSLLIIDILRNLNQSSEIEVMAHDSIANRKYLLSGENRLIQVPNSLNTFFKFISSGIISGIPKGILQEPFTKSKLPANEDESVESFISRRFGNSKLSNNILSGILHGIYAGDISKLSVRSILPSLVNLETENGSIIRGMIKKTRQTAPKEKLSPSLVSYEDKISKNSNLLELSTTLKKYPMVRLKHGLQTLPISMAKYLQLQPNVEIHYNSKIQEINAEKCQIVVNNQIQHYDHIRSTINTNTLSKLITHSEIKAALPLEYVSIFLVNIYCPKPILIPPYMNGFGFLVPKANQNHECLLGIIYDSDIEHHVQSLYLHERPSSDNYNKITLMMGGHYYNKIGIPSNNMNMKAIKKILSSVLNINLEKYNLVFRNEVEVNDKSLSLEENDILISYNLHRDCIPQYNVGYEKQKQKVFEVMNQQLNGKLSLGGMGFATGIGVPDCVMNGLEDSLKLA
ncbi:uncharacterized protein AC631_02320 [Debaryomyces fabryi]|uniref:Protoporphyrinogen oxidase n=1 Tax=Debaryomyces fabryi TaxID=58627 RepID=A0A0V1Q0M2_9ASCO|nr:uncharacterized protein AC631_02320 [Debaryomyces fabryi]KSA01948.1 hypothetical protein AC631_02320 [Debaryomyces fabryi]CUM48488.1 unnamed protein product [Debaryomyces fabryi]